MPTRKTLFWVGAAVLLYLISWNVGSGWLYFLTALLLAFPLVSIILSRINTGRIDIKLASPPSVTTGERLPVTLNAINRSFWPRFCLEIDIDFVGSRKLVFLPVLGPKATSTIELWFDDPQRGVYAGAVARLSSAAPAGLARSRRRFNVDSPAVVYPGWQLISSDWATGQKNTGYMVSSAIPTRNTASEYLGVRDYRPGDSPRSIHWRTSARTNNLAVIEYARQTAMTPVFLVDRFSEADKGEGAASTFETAVSIAASLAQRESRQNRRFGLGHSPEDAGIRGLGHQFEEAMFWLAQVEATAQKPMDLSGAMFPWPEVTPVIILTSHAAYGRLDRSEFLRDFPHSLVIMLDGRNFEKEKRSSSAMMDDEQLEKLADGLEGLGAELLLIASPEEAAVCLMDL